MIQMIPCTCCKKCKHRYPACHDECADYISFKERNEMALKAQKDWLAYVDVDFKSLRNERSIRVKRM